MSAGPLPLQAPPRPRRSSVRRPLGFCPDCGTALSPAIVESRVLGSCRDCGHVAYPNPAVVAVTVLQDAERSGHLWLIRRAIAPFRGEWALPGGYVEAGEHPEQAAARECTEEVLAPVRIDRLLGVHSATYGSGGGVVVIAYAGILCGPPAAGPEVAEVRRFPATARPPLAFDTHEAAVAQWQASS